jgi:plastocyanin
MLAKVSLGIAALSAMLVLAPAASAAEYQITMAKMKFGAAPAVLHVGDVIVWRNDDIFRHTATARDKSFDVDLPPKSERRMTIEKAGAVDFYCRFHPAMTGRLDVQP